MKHLFFIRRERTGLKDFALSKLVPQLLMLEPQRLKVSLTDDRLPRFTILPLNRDGLIMLSVWGEIDPLKWQLAIQRFGLEVSGYAVEESRPLAYIKSWDDGKVSPGAVLLTMLKMNPALSCDEFMYEWHGRHTPKAMRIHPMWSYIRNVTKAPVSESSPQFEGFVEEHYRSDADLLNPVRMFGGWLRCIPHMVEVARHVNQFLDLAHCENYILREYHIIS